MLTSLVGLPGSGKSTIGRRLARDLGWRFLDVDLEVEREVGCSIASIFEQFGEGRFRDVEEEVIARLTQESDAVIATGGGAVLRAANRRLLRESSTVIYLRASPDALFRRLRKDTKRPLLQVADPMRKLRELYAERDPLYRETAHFVMEMGRPTVSTLVNMILMQLELAGVVDPSIVASSVGESFQAPDRG